MADPCADTDIPSELYLNGYPLVAEQIFSHLKPDELCRACQVCRTWYEQISVSRPLMATLTNFRGKQQQSQKSKPPPKQSSDENSHKVLKCRPCPDCQSPAKVLNLRRAECPSCHLDFCQHCFRPWHSGRCVTPHSPDGVKKPSVICGTKKNKRRLRRL